MSVDCNAFAHAGVLDGDGVSGIVRVGENSLAFTVENGGNGSQRVRLACAITVGATHHAIDASVPVVRTRQRAGEHRWWSCPRCSRRARVLYVPPVGAIELGCRSCLRLVHASAVESRPRHRTRRAPLETKALAPPNPSS